MESLLEKFNIQDIEAIKSDTTDTNLNIEIHDYKDEFQELASKKYKLINNQKTYTKLLELIQNFEKDIDISKDLDFEYEQNMITSLDITTPNEIEMILKDPITQPWIDLSLKVLAEENTLINKILKNIIIERCKKVLIQTVKQFKTEAMEVQQVHHRLLRITQITDIMMEYQYENFLKFAILYKQCIHWYYRFYCLHYFNVLKDVKIDSVETIQEQASSYLAKWMNSTVDENTYGDHDTFMKRLTGFVGNVKDYVIPLQIIENNTALNWNVEDFIKNMCLTLKSNYIKELDFVNHFIVRDDTLANVFKVEDSKYKEIFDNEFLFNNCSLIIKNITTQIEQDYLGIFISIRLIQGYIEELEKIGCDDQMVIFFNDVLTLILWPKYQTIINSTILNHSNLKTVSTIKYLDFLKNILFIDLYFGNSFDWSKDPQFQTFMNSLSIFESQNVNVKNNKQSWFILMMNLLDSIDLELLDRLETQEAYDEFMNKDNNILVTLRNRYTSVL